MTATKLLAALALAGITAFSPAFAQDAAFQLPEQCATSSGSAEMAAGQMHGSSTKDGKQPGMDSDMSAMMGMGQMDMEAMPEHVRENMRRMMASMPAMHQGMMLEDADVAFACAMIAHHQGAIDMSEVLLKYGKDEETRALAEGIIAAQAEEIGQMTAWLAEHAK